MRSIHDPKVGGIGDPNKGHEFAQIGGLDPPGTGVVDVGEPLGFGWHVGEALEFLGGEDARAGNDWDGQGGFGEAREFFHTISLLLKK